MCELPIKLAVPGEFKEPARSRIPLVKTLLLILSLLVLINSSLLASQETKPKKVLVLASYKATAPVAHLWLDSAQSWVAVSDDVLRYPGQPDDFAPIIRAWAARHPGSETR